MQIKNLYILLKLFAIKWCSNNANVSLDEIDQLITLKANKQGNQIIYQTNTIIVELPSNIHLMHIDYGRWKVFPRFLYQYDCIHFLMIHALTSKINKLPSQRETASII